MQKCKNKASHAIVYGGEATFPNHTCLEHLASLLSERVSVHTLITLGSEEHKSCCFILNKVEI